MTADLPDLLTVEEAALLLRIGRTKAYALTREWRATDGRAGLPVVDFGHVLRVPRHALERLIGGPLTGSVPAVRGEARGDTENTCMDQTIGGSGGYHPVPDQHDYDQANAHSGHTH